MANMFRHFLFSILIISTPLLNYAQGVAKAYEGVNYRGTVNGRKVRLFLANGYIGASNLKMDGMGHVKAVSFQPDAGEADEYHQLKFEPFPQSSSGYFVLENMQEAYEDIPAVITGSYYLNGTKMPVRFGLIKRHKH